jgi:hypothetical protein
MEELTTIAAVIETLGGNRPVADLTNSETKTVSMWKTFGRFPWHAQLPITEALRAQGKEPSISLFGMKKPAAETGASS